jgi:hypothetical protein
MAGNEDIQNLDLDQILRTLASLPKAENAPQHDQQAPYDPTQLSIPSETALPYHDQGPTAFSSGYEAPTDPRLNGRTPLPYPKPQIPQAQPSPPIIDPATITSWKHGLRCVNKIAAQHPDFATMVQKLIRDQERNVKEWQSARQRLIEDQKLKRENEKTHRLALSLPGVLDNTAPLRTPAREKEELEQYDAKVYRASQLMVESHSAQLKGLGVPFFGVSPDLVVEDGDGQTANGKLTGQETSKKLTKKELLELQRKMLTHLVELYGD